MTFSPESAEVSRLLTLLAGLVLAAFAVAMAALIAFMGWRVLQGELRVSGSGLLLVAVLAASAYGVGTLAWRLIANRPNRYGSIMGPVAWRIAAVISLISAVGSAYGAFLARDLTLVGVSITGTLMTVWSWRKSVALAETGAAGRSETTHQNTRGE
jgi:hypothetical protein